MVRRIASIRDVHCKHCGSRDTVKYGVVNTVQRFFCKQCKRKFADNAAMPHMRTPAKQVATAVGAYFDGLSINAIRRQLQQQYNNCPSQSTVYEWLRRFARTVVAEDRLHKPPKVGDHWVADETMLKIGGNKVWFWDIIDAKTRYLLASHISTVRTTNDAKMLVERAARRAGKTPKSIATDSLAAYIDGIELAFGSDTRHIKCKGLTARQNTNIIERFHSTLKTRTRVMRGLKHKETARILLDAWLVHYNHFRSHMFLKGRTPGEAAGSDYPYRDWADVVGRQYTAQPTIQADVVDTLEPLLQRTMRRPAVRRTLQLPTAPRMPRPYMTSRKRGPYYATSTPDGSVMLSRMLPRGAKVRRRKRR